MRTTVKSGDILDEEVDVLISTANVNLNMSGGVNGAILLRGGHDVQQELQGYLKRVGKNWVPPGTVVRTGPGPLRVKHILHAVSIDGFYQSSVELVERTIERSLTEAARLGAKTVALPALATGYGPLSILEFAQALRGATIREFAPIEELRVVLRRADEADIVATAFGMPPHEVVTPQSPRPG
jgi:O-acetyl-ADP-ribose deacetylase